MSQSRFQVSKVVQGLSRVREICVFRRSGWDSLSFFPTFPTFDRGFKVWKWFQRSSLRSESSQRDPSFWRSGRDFFKFFSTSDGGFKVRRGFQKAFKFWDLAKRDQSSFRPSGIYPGKAIEMIRIGRNELTWKMAADFFTYMPVQRTWVWKSS